MMSDFILCSPMIASSNHTNNRNSAKITGYIDTDESTVGLYNWALLPPTNPDCYKGITVEYYKSGKLLRKATFSKAFVVGYSEDYSIDKGVGIFTIHLRQYYARDIKVDEADEVAEKYSILIKQIQTLYMN